MAFFCPHKKAAAVFRLSFLMILAVFGLIGGIYLSLANPNPTHAPASAPSEQPASIVTTTDEPLKTSEMGKWTSFDDSIFQLKLLIAQSQSALSEQVLSVALSFKGTPYVHGTLETPRHQEHLVVNMRELDCWTFVENSLAVALTSRAPLQDYAEFQHFVQQLRYWGGNIDGYGSRIHYFSGWLMQAEKLGYLHDVTQELGGIPYEKKVGYMSARPGKYPALNDSKALSDLKAVENRINGHQWYYIPKNRVAKMEHLIQEGDIIALTSWKHDLDIAHQGFAVKINGRIHLLHASSLNGRVILSAQPLPQYMATQKGQTGIMVARL